MWGWLKAVTREAHALYRGPWLRLFRRQEEGYLQENKHKTYNSLKTIRVGLTCWLAVLYFHKFLHLFCERQILSPAEVRSVVGQKPSAVSPSGSAPALEPRARPGGAVLHQWPDLAVKRWPDASHPKQDLASDRLVFWRGLLNWHKLCQLLNWGSSVMPKSGSN